MAESEQRHGRVRDAKEAIIEAVLPFSVFRPKCVNF